MIRFSLCHASGRLPYGWRKAAQSWLKTCDCPQEVEHILAIDEHLYLQHTLVFPHSTVRCVVPSRGSTHQYNEAAAVADGVILIQIADDLFPCPHWDSLILNALPLDYASSPYVLSQDNSDNSDLITHAIMTRPYYERFGYIGHPDYKHLMEDVEFTDVANASGCVIQAKQIRFRHLNPEAGTAEWDDVYRRQRTPELLKWAQALYERRKAAGFPQYSMLTAEEREAVAC